MGDKWNLPDKAKFLADERLLITVGTGDVVSKKSLHHDILASEIKKYNKGNLTEKFAATRSLLFKQENLASPNSC